MSITSTLTYQIKVLLYKMPGNTCTNACETLNLYMLNFSRLRWNILLKLIYLYNAKTLDYNSTWLSIALLYQMADITLKNYSQ